MNYLIPGAGLVLILIILVFFVFKTIKQTKELRFALGNSKREIRELSKCIKELESKDPNDFTDDDKKKLDHLSNTLRNLSKTGNS